MGRENREKLRAQATTGARGLAQGFSRKWEESGAASRSAEVAEQAKMKLKESGATDVVVGTARAAQGVVGTARAMGGAIRLAGTVVGPVVGAARAASAQAK